MILIPVLPRTMLDRNNGDLINDFVDHIIDQIRIPRRHQLPHAADRLFASGFRKQRKVL